MNIYKIKPYDHPYHWGDFKTTGDYLTAIQSWRREIKIAELMWKQGIRVVL